MNDCDDPATPATFALYSAKSVAFRKIIANPGSGVFRKIGPTRVVSELMLERSADALRQRVLLWIRKNEPGNELPDAPDWSDRAKAKARRAAGAQINSRGRRRWRRAILRVIPILFDAALAGRRAACAEILCELIPLADAVRLSEASPNTFMTLGVHKSFRRCHYNKIIGTAAV